MIKPFKIIFRQVGKVRDLHIEEANFKKHLQEKVLVALRAELTKQQLKEKKLFFSLISEKTIKQLKNKYNKTVAFLYEVDSQKVDDYMLKKRNEIKVFLNQPHLEE
ncbi:MAG: iron-sulfur cluster repair protein YtfE (RIC family) [Flavobacterium sp.]|jgi:iron-sulfur cluster repair protein YtfE (RIC family)